MGPERRTIRHGSAEVTQTPPRSVHPFRCSSRSHINRARGCAMVTSIADRSDRVSQTVKFLPVLPRTLATSIRRNSNQLTCQIRRKGEAEFFVPFSFLFDKIAITTDYIALLFPLFFRSHARNGVGENVTCRSHSFVHDVEKY